MHVFNDDMSEVKMLTDLTRFYKEDDNFLLFSLNGIKPLEKGDPIVIEDNVYIVTFTSYTVDDIRGAKRLRLNVFLKAQGEITNHKKYKKSLKT